MLLLGKPFRSYHCRDIRGFAFRISGKLKIKSISTNMIIRFGFDLV